MKKVTLFFLNVAVYGQMTAQTPFKQLGIKDNEIEYLTLSDGRYVEFHGYNDFERVGSAIIDMQTNKIARFVGRDSVREVGMYEMDMTTRFLTIDPMAEKYYEISPYAYCANNPILFVDPNGDTINISSALMNNEMAYAAFNTWYNSDVGKEFQSIFGVGGEFEGVSVNFGIDENEVGDAKGDTKVFGVNEDGEKRQINLKDGLKKEEYLRFDVNVSPSAKSQVGQWGDYNENMQPIQYTAKSAAKANYMRTINTASTFLHESQHVQIIHGDINSDNSYDIHPYYQHERMKNTRGIYYYQRKSFYQKLNIYNVPFNPNGIDN